MVCVLGVAVRSPENQELLESLTLLPPPVRSIEFEGALGAGAEP
jgi:hypothetical protein